MAVSVYGCVASRALGGENGAAETILRGLLGLSIEHEPKY